jgi:EAL domain-containing protein (putative c-di-GMP-specific phosphodiesterase class I)
MSVRRLIGFEALIRLRKENGSLISPLDFIPVAEDMRLIDKIGAWVLREACGTAATWPEHLAVAVNLSPAQFFTGSVSMHMRVTAEGVETAEQVAFLDKANGDQAQGFFLGRPIPARSVAASILANFQQQQAVALKADPKLHLI